ncbi:hypothetical protein DPMN_004996 [Dreissena polymorpha]|uniref:Uncharacterized protein n=1 Tax=Dreissena polymorpha TaxID=45954 RepID=A0A9D4RWE4_DREPO|nr:hypothetical protein DPMN_004996 [Dreissena polymorpha]
MKFHDPRHIFGTNIVTKIHEDLKINVASRVLTRKNTPPLAAMFLTRALYFQSIITIFEPIKDIIETYILAKFYEDWTINVASTELTRQMLAVHDGHKAITKAHHEHRHDQLSPSTIATETPGVPRHQPKSNAF